MKKRKIENIITHFLRERGCVPASLKLDLWIVWFVSVLGKIAMTMRWIVIVILTTQWCETCGSQVRFLLKRSNDK